MVREWVWGDVPAGFRRFSPNRMQMVLVREGLEIYPVPQNAPDVSAGMNVLDFPEGQCPKATDVSPWYGVYLDPQRFTSHGEMAKETALYYGRGKLLSFPLGNGSAALVRVYRHGGLLRQLPGKIFFTWPPRPFRELATTVEARRRGVPTLEILGACVERVWGPFYRGWLVTRELKGGDGFWAALQNEAYSEKGGMSLLQSVARGVRSMHQQGVYHGDLNLKNIVVRREGDAIKSYLIDFDKARLFSGRVPAERARKNLRRLLRSIGKLDPDRRRLSREAWDLFIRFYREVDLG